MYIRMHMCSLRTPDVKRKLCIHDAAAHFVYTCLYIIYCRHVKRNLCKYLKRNLYLFHILDMWKDTCVYIWRETYKRDLQKRLVAQTHWLSLVSQLRPRKYTCTHKCIYVVYVRQKCEKNPVYGFFWQQTYKRELKKETFGKNPVYGFFWQQTYKRELKKETFQKKSLTFSHTSATPSWLSVDAMYVKRDLNIYEKRPIKRNYERNFRRSQLRHICQKSRICVKRDLYMWKETWNREL